MNFIRAIAIVLVLAWIALCGFTYSYDWGISDEMEECPIVETFTVSDRYIIHVQSCPFIKKRSYGETVTVLVIDTENKTWCRDEAC